MNTNKIDNSSCYILNYSILLMINDLFFIPNVIKICISIF